MNPRSRDAIWRDIADVENSTTRRALEGLFLALLQEIAILRDARNHNAETTPTENADA